MTTYSDASQQSAKIGFREIGLALLGFTAVLILVFWELLSLKVGFISGDHKDPWMSYLASELQAGRFPLWTGLIGCGFPIFAEGQIAALYPFNLILYGLLPFEIAYNYSTLFHYLMGAVFFYLFSRHLSISSKGSFLAALIYLFGSSQGGYFYNMNSQKTCIWFPLTLLLIEKYLKGGRP